jgi:GT2 family glycosyltransferase
MSDVPEAGLPVSVAILNWNGGDLVLSCLRSILRQTYPIAARIVVDNASTDSSLDRLRMEDPGLEVIANPRNVGFARAANQAVEAAAGHWLLLANLDVEFEPDYVERLVCAGQRDSRIGSVTGKLLRPRRPGSDVIVDSTGHLLYRNGWAANRGEGEPDQGQWERPSEVFGVTGAAPLYRVEMLRDVTEGIARPFDERFFAYIEDVDLDWRMRWLGWKAWYEPAVAWHHRSATGARRSSFILRHILKNRLLLIANNDLWPGGLRRLPNVLAFTLVTALQFGMESPPAVLGVLDFVRLAHTSLRRRRFLARRRWITAKDLAGWMQPFPYRQKIRRKLRARASRAAEG